MFKVIKTVAARLLNIQTELGFPYEPLPGTTLNELLEIPNTADLSKYPKLAYACVGVTDAINNDLSLYSNRHGSRDAALFNMVPIIVRGTDNDLSAMDAIKYKLRVVRNDKIYYFLRKIDIIPEVPSAYILSGDNVNQDIEDYVTSDIELHPVPIDRLSVMGENNYLVVASKIIINMSVEELHLLKDAVTSWLGTDDYIVGEIGLVMGTVDDGEISHAQIAYFLDLETSVKTVNIEEDYVLNLDMGGTELLI